MMQQRVCAWMHQAYCVRRHQGAQYMFAHMGRYSEATRGAVVLWPDAGLWRGMPVAVKTLFFSGAGIGQRKRALQEAALSNAIAHPNIVTTYVVDAQPITSLIGANGSSSSSSSGALKAPLSSMAVRRIQNMNMVHCVHRPACPVRVIGMHIYTHSVDWIVNTCACHTPTGLIDPCLLLLHCTVCMGMTRPLVPFLSRSGRTGGCTLSRSCAMAVRCGSLYKRAARMLHLPRAW